MAKEKRELELEIIHNRNSEVTFKISKQSHRGEQFNDGQNSFTATNGMILHSCNSPEYTGGNTLYVQGDNGGDDNKQLRATSAWFKKIEEAVRQFNIANSGVLKEAMDTFTKCMTDGREAELVKFVKAFNNPGHSNAHLDKAMVEIERREKERTAINAQVDEILNSYEGALTKARELDSKVVADSRKKYKDRIEVETVEINALKERATEASNKKHEWKDKTRKSERDSKTAMRESESREKEIDRVKKRLEEKENELRSRYEDHTRWFSRMEKNMQKEMETIQGQIEDLEQRRQALRSLANEDNIKRTFAEQKTVRSLDL